MTPGSSELLTTTPVEKSSQIALEPQETTIVPIQLPPKEGPVEDKELFPEAKEIASGILQEESPEDMAEAGVLTASSNFNTMVDAIISAADSATSDELLVAITPEPSKSTATVPLTPMPLSTSSAVAATTGKNRLFVECHTAYHKQLVDCICEKVFSDVIEYFKKYNQKVILSIAKTGKQHEPSRSIDLAVEYCRTGKHNEPEQTISLILEYDLVKSNGDMFYYASRVVAALCPLKIQRFPFDQQVCEVGFSSYTFWIAEVQLVSAVKPTVNTSTAGTGEWTVIEIITGSPEKLLESTSATYETISYIIRVKRSSTFYIVMIVLPSFVLTFLCVLGLFWTKFDKTDYLEKLALGFAAILAMCTVLEIAEQSVPKTTQLPALCKPL
ncbi:hypothetical protein TELCIR_01178 [Teladorsagia circumcincta]|uniref:Neurotransmitter-gated ion-channel ligand-binding domain-containing protein n=1 Tax=Teladorsagia circumcincta TaxID=45464 RepID=A0A2G9V2Q0_TELCI|nr:hypothetical protein TELCIR_01178 [Teladorsagia circumcincta]